VAPIEVFFGAIVFVFCLIGLARGFLRELGVTTIVVFLLFFLSRFEPYLDSGLDRMMAAGGRLGPAFNKDLMEWWVFFFVIVATAFVSYQGETLAFGGQMPSNMQSILLGGMTGFINGYLIAGSLWFYLHKFNYPVAFLGFSADRLSPLAREVIPFLPITFLGQPILFGQSLLLYLCGLLLLARVIR
jgi:hypothetical protein